MRLISFAAGFIALLAASGARAASLTDCNEENSTRVRTECLQANLVLLNSSYETVAKELRAAVADLKTTRERFDKEIGVLRGEIEKLKKDVKVLQDRPTPDLTNVLTNGSRVQLQSVNIFDKAFCLDHDTNNSNHVQGWICHDQQVWQLNRK